jgi:hypothetical protein
VAKKLVEVALVVVPLMAVKFWRVEEPERRRFESEVSPPVTFKVPVKLAALEMFWLLIRPEVMAPVLREVAKRFVLLATPEKKLVEVALPEIKALPLTDNLSFGVVEPMPVKPFELIVRAAVVEVAKVDGEPVAM